MDDTIHIACCFDRQMELPFLVLANSIKRRLKGDRKVVVHAFHSDPPVHNRAFSRGLDCEYFEVRYLRTRNEYDGVPVKNFSTAATLMRLMLPMLLTCVDRVLYLDCDMIVLRDITELHDTDLKGCALAAVPDFSMTGVCVQKGLRIGTEPHTWLAEAYLTEVVDLTNWKDYFNAGVLLMDLDQFRRKDLVAEAVDFLERTDGRRLLNDQDALNHVADGAFVPLDARWNVVGCRNKRDFEDVDAELAHVADLWWSDPWIIHYAGYGKPWRPDRPLTPWDNRFWNEAAGCEVLPLLLDSYLKWYEETGFTRLELPERLLALGKPALDKSRIEAHARKFASIPEVSSASMRIAADLDMVGEAGDCRSALFPAGLFENHGGVAEDQTLAFNLANAAGHIVYGPYFWYPRGNYEAVFEISLTTGTSDGQGKLVIEVTDDSFNFLAQRSLLPQEVASESSRTQVFEATGLELFIEFRIFAEGFAGGTLRFSGLNLQRAVCGTEEGGSANAPVPAAQ